MSLTKDVTEKVIVDAGARTGERIEPGYFLLAQRNRKPEIHLGRGSRMTLAITGGYTDTSFIGETGKYKQTDPLIGGLGVYIVSVPQGRFAKIWSGVTPLLLDEGPHVIHDVNFRVENPQSFFVPKSSSYITHGNMRIIRVPAGHYAKIVVNQQPRLLNYRQQPYCFDTPLFEFDPDNGFVSQNESYIAHGIIHLIRVPAGRVGKAWLGSKPLLMEYRDEPYFFEDAMFKFEPKSRSELFEDALEKHIRHGTIDRLRPGVHGDLERAVIQRDGLIEFIDRFTTLDDAHHAVLGFLNMGLQTHVFPSKETREERKRENAKATTQEITYEPMTTKDSLKVGLKLLVAFQVNDAHKVLSKLRIQDIIVHVENLAVSDMARAVQNSTSQNFLNSTIRKSNLDVEEHEKTITDRVREELAHHLDDCGLKLVRFNIEEAKVLDEELAKEMAKQSLVAATASAQQAVIEQKAAVAKSNAELEAMARRVQQDQENAIKVSSAQADLEAAKLRAQAAVVEAEARQKAWEFEGSQYQKYPELLQLKIAQLQAESLRQSTLTIVAPEIADTPFCFAGGAAIGGLFQKKA